MSRHLEELARRAAAESDASADAAVLDEARRRALAGFQPRSQARSAARSLVSARGFALAAAALIALALVFVGFRAAPTLTYTVGDEGSPHAIGAWIAASDRDVPLRFSEGTVLTLGAEARARVTRADADGAEVVLERGAVKAKVVHRSASTRWSVRAGPFEVHVVGTELAVAWDPSRDEIDVHIREGRVIVTGPLLDGGRALSTGERLHVAVREQKLNITVEASNDAAPPSEAPSAEASARAPNGAADGQRADCPPDRCPQGITTENNANPSSDPSGGAAARGPASPAPGDAAAPTWRELAAGGKHKGAMEAVDREGFANVLARASGPDLLALADVARYSGDYGRARSALLRARDKGQRGRPAFLLGKIAADNLGAPGDAITWFQTYLAEEPGGGLAEQALGRIIELKKRSGDAAGARAAAEKYLARYPSGAYAALAKLASE